MKYKEADGWLHFIKWFSTNPRIKQAFITQTILETTNWGILSPKLSTRLITCSESVIEKRQRNRRVVFSYHGH